MTTHNEPLNTELDIEKEFNLERLAMEMGIAKYRETLAQDGIESLTPGKQLLKAAMMPMVEAVKAWLESTGEGVARRSAGVYTFLTNVSPEAIAWITANTILSRLHEEPKVVNVAATISQRLEATINIEEVSKANPRLADKIIRAIEKMGDSKNRIAFVKRGAELVDVKIIQWDQATEVRVGTLLIAMFEQSTGLVVSETVIRGRGTKPVHLRPSESCRRWLEESHARCELLEPVRMPMVCLPRSWTNPYNGGYLFHELRQSLVKTRNKGYLSELRQWDMDWVYASVNALQETEWAVNEGIYKVVKDMWEAGSSAAGLPSRLDLPLPSRNWDENEPPSPAVLHAWKVDAAKTHEVNAKGMSKRIQLVHKLYSAELMVERGNRFHYVYNLDWRGRIYPVAPSLSPQGDDVSKALLRFSNGVALGDDGAYWLAIHGANSFGVDKVSFEERIQWVEDNLDMILACGNDPMADQRWADTDPDSPGKVDAPFAFLAFCMEYAKLQRWVDAGNAQESFMSTLPVGFDGSCNGLQNFSAMLRDPVGGKATGLIPSDTPADIYSEVKKVTQAIIDKDAAGGDEVAQRWVGKMTRKLAKRNTMTVPYGVTKRGMRDQLFKELEGTDGKFRSADAEYLAACNYEAIGTVVVAARLAMDWLKAAAKVAASNKLPVRWVTPAGLLVVQDYREEEGQALDFVALGRRYQLMIQKTGDCLNTRKQALGISPNYVHSLDAAHLMRTVLFCAQDGITDFAMIHDSYGCHAGHASLLRDNLREAFVEQYSGNVLEKFRNELLEQLPDELKAELPPLPPMGNLDLEQVKGSEYFFA